MDSKLHTNTLVYAKIIINKNKHSRSVATSALLNFHKQVEQLSKTVVFMLLNYINDLISMKLGILIYATETNTHKIKNS